MSDLPFDLPPRLRWLEGSSNGREWLSGLPARVKACADLWSLRLDARYTESQVSVVFAVTLTDRSPAVLKLQFPHPECEHEAEALRLWNGQGAVRLFAYAPAHHALLMEKCDPGDPLSGIAHDEALDVFTKLLPRLWVDASEPFTPLYRECAAWAEQLPASWERAGRPFEEALLDAAVGAIHALRRRRAGRCSCIRISTARMCCELHVSRGW